MKASVSWRTLHFKQPATTSRGMYTTHTSYYVTLEREGVCGVGECSPLPDLSCDALPHERYLGILQDAANQVAMTGRVPKETHPFPSMRFGLETALRSLATGGNAALSDTPFAHGQQGIPINGLVWMGTYDEMMTRLEEKLNNGYRCVKLKIGAIDWEREESLIARVRQHFGHEQVELRVDANGGFRNDEALDRLRTLAAYDIHSIEQPIRQGQWAEMAELCRRNILPIALDEELIGINDSTQKAALLDTIRPQYIVLKPSLHGGFEGTREWVHLAQQRHIGNWITSALESNIGLNAVAHLCAELYGPNIIMPQGLGTGMLYSDNIEMPLHIKEDRLWFLPNS
ncbi:MAG: o-succinylbenzoate synthase [Bacteroidaceae bacterium]|nr:o-succinylbenzoate synthase [Prevotellaceae bacterium]MDY5631877.1 o-succinylbenzoate synthase [Bacteroidaceae bacterium]